MLSTRSLAVVWWLALGALGLTLSCSSRRGGGGDDDDDVVDLDDAGPANDSDASGARDAGDCEQGVGGSEGARDCDYSAPFVAATDGVVRSPCAYDVASVLSLGGDVFASVCLPEIELAFPDGTSFAGTSDGVDFVATRTQDFPYQDGCTWRATETLTGSIDGDAACAMRTTYAYREEPIEGTACATPCTIDADVIFTPVVIE